MKLAKIGTTTHENQVINQSEMLRGLWRPNAKLIIYTEEQRRELVRAAWDMGMKQVCGTCGDVWCGHNKNSVDFDEWIKEQGL